MALVQRLLSFQFELASSSFVESGTDQMTLDGLRATAKIVKAGTPSLGEAQLQIFGMTLSQMNQLATLGMVYQLIPRNIVTVSAGDADAGMSTVFKGTITQAWGAFSDAPNVPFNVQAHTLGAESVITAAPASYNGSTSAADVMSNLAGQMGLTFENNGVSVQISNPYFYGSPRSQADACAATGGFEWFADDTTLAIWPKGKSRTGGDTPLISADTGMVGYPSFTAYGLAVTTIFNSQLKFGGQFKVDSQLTPATGPTWVIAKLSHDLSTLFPHGDWFTHVEGFNSNFPQPVLG